MEMDSEGKTYF